VTINQLEDPDDKHEQLGSAGVLGELLGEEVEQFVGPKGKWNRSALIVLW
jgi:hypothetical protein